MTALLVGCGSPEGGASASASEGSTTRTSDPTTTSETTGSGTAGESMTTGGGESMSASDATTSGAPTTSTGTTDDSTTAGITESESESESESGGPNLCGDDPPPGFSGDFDESCANEPKVGSFDPVVEWTRDTWTESPTSAQIMMQPVVGPLTDDDSDGVYGSDGDIPTILAVTFAGTAWTSVGVLRAVRGDDGSELFSISGQGIGGSSGIAIANIDDDPAPEIVVVTTSAGVKAFEHDGTPKWTSANYPGDFGSYPAGAAPAVADMDGDGKPEIVVGRLILNHDGTLRGRGAYGVGQGQWSAASFPADIDGDGTLEVVTGNALYRPDGTAIWNLNLSDGFPAIANFTGDSKPEIVVTGGGTVRLHDATGATIWSVANPGGVGGPPTIADFDGDGEPEIGVAGKTHYVVFDGDGSVLWLQPTQDASSSSTGSAVYDFEGDGVADVVYADETSLWVFSGLDGTVKMKAPHNSGTLIEYPIIADVDNDGEVEIVVGHTNAFFGGDLRGLSVLGDLNSSWRPGRRIWNQHAYSITNVGEHGEIPPGFVPNWPQYNSFRSGDLSGNNGTSAPDLKLITPESCLNECEGAEEAKIWIQVGNAGAVALTAGATIAVFVTKEGVESLDQELDFAEILEPGEYSAGFSLVVNTVDVESIRIVGTPKESECVVDPGDEVVLMPPFCTLPG